MNPLTVSALTTQIVTLFQNSEVLRDVWVSGEVSNWKKAASGHMYFRLKDSGATISAVMWRNAAQGQSWQPREGDQVLAHGYVGVYPEGGNYQLYANILRPAGRGQLYAQFEELKARLEAAGFFAAERKRPIPVAPARVAIVTSADAAALRDVLRVLSARWPLGEAVVFPTLVQGSEAPAQIAQAIAAANRYSREVAPCGVLLLVRGGGSIEDLWAFNDERVAAAVAASDLPVVCGVGHETDFTIADFVADLRAPTPSAAAMAITPDRAEVLARLGAVQRRLAQDALSTLAGEQRSLAQVATRLERLHPRRRLDTQLQRLDERTRRLHLAMNRRHARRAERRENAVLRLEALNPARVLQRGYSIVQRQNGEVVTGPAGTAAGEQLQVRAAGGDYVVTKVS